MTFIKKHSVTIGITCRVFIALLGGFLLANLVAILIANCFVDAKSGDNLEGIVTGMMTSFIVYTLVVMFVFATRTAGRAAFGVTTACTITFAIISTFELAVKL